MALGTAVLETLRDLALRRVLRQSGWSTLRVIGLSSALAALLLAVPLLLAQSQPLDGWAFLAALAVGGSLNALAFWGYGRAIALEDLSLVLPLINLSPLVLLLAGWWVLGERPSPSAVAGVGLLVLGACCWAAAAEAGRRRGAWRGWASSGPAPVAAGCCWWR
nr:EamA family transporter [Cyanobium sp. LEGE 06113]